MTEPPRRASSDTLPMPSREEIDHALSSRAPPPELQAELARAQGLDVEACAVCGVGMVPTLLNQRMKYALPPLPAGDETVDALPADEGDTQP